MDTDSANSSFRSRDVITDLLEIAKNRPGTNAAKAILAYHEAPGLSTLISVLEEVSKNTDYSTDLRLSLSYYIDEFLNQIDNMPRRLVFSAASSVLDYCGKIYGDRVELMLQVVEQQIASLLIDEPKADESTNATGNKEPRKRRTKKLVQKENDMFAFNMEPRKFKTMSDEKRFSRLGFETNKNKNRTIEHMYLDHTPSHLWKYAPIVEPDNPNDQDEKKNYKLFTYLPEPRYNTLLPDIQFERLNLIKEYVHANHDLSETRHENMSNREYLDEYIALENQMLASRFGDLHLNKHPLDNQCDEMAKRISLEQKRPLECIENSPKRIKFCETQDTNLTADKSGVPETDLEDTLNTLKLTDVSEAQLNDSQLPENAFSSTLAMNDSSCLNSTRLDLEKTDSVTESGLTTQPVQEQTQSITEPQTTSQLDPSVAAADESNDAGIGMENVTIPLVTDNLEDQNHQRMQSLSPKVLVQDILPGVPGKENFSVRVDSEMLALGGVNEEIVEATRKVYYPIILNVFSLPKKKLRSERLFALSADFKLFMEQRLPSKRVVVPKPPRTVNIPPPPPDADPELEFDINFNFLGFRRPTHDSGIDHEEIQAESVDVTNDENPVLNATETVPLPDEIQIVRDNAQTENDETLLNMPMDTMETTTLNETTTNLGLDSTKTLSNIPMDTMDTTDLNEISGLSDIATLTEIPLDTISISAIQHDSGLEATPMSFETNPEGLDATDTDWDADETIVNCTSIDEETDAKINEWHRRMAPVLELAHDRQNFSIEELNKEVIQKCVERNGEATLADILEGKDPTKLSCYLLSSLLLINHGNVALQTPKRYEPIEMDQFKIKLLSTELKQVNPEDEIGNVNNAANQHDKPGTAAPQTTEHTAKGVRRKSTEPYEDEATKVKIVRLIKPVPKASVRPDDADSGISSLAASISSVFSTVT